MDSIPDPNDIYLEFLNGLDDTAAEWEEEVHVVERQVAENWGKPLTYLQAVLVRAHSFGAAINEEEFVSQKDDDVYRALVRLHAQACLRASEIVSLLRSGHADGAYARWRSLQEIGTVSAFIALEGPVVAGMFLDHNIVKAWEDAKDNRLRSHSGPSVSDVDFDTVQQEVKALCQKYGDAFQGSHGWAAAAVRRKRPELAKTTIRLSHIEEHVGSDPFFVAEYRQASHTVHPSSKGIHFPLGRKPGSNHLLSGPSQFGLFEPGFNTPLSLYRITALLLYLGPTEERLRYLDALRRIVQECVSAFVEAAKREDMLQSEQ